ncbi:exported hypothetical protein [metagenome]|uniref:Uncharacterized protein n=1 Tax=metagenome TaxID=256318 RepID=A0A2P2BWE3_9ZZZZ
MVRRCAVLVSLMLAAGLLMCAPTPLASAGSTARAQGQEVGEPCRVSAVLVNSCRPWFGGTANNYPDVSGNKLDQLRYFETRVGRQMDVAHTYHVLGDDALNATDLFFVNRPQTILMTNWVLTRDWASADGSNAAVNAAIDSMATSIKAVGDTRIMLTLFHEPENDVTSDPGCPGTAFVGTAGTTEDYTAMWANVRARFDALGVTNVVWVLNYMNYPTWNCVVPHLYPGNDLVDWVVFNAYQQNDTDVSFKHRVDNLYDVLTAASTPQRDYLSKPWGIVEWGIHRATQANTALYYEQARLAAENNTFPQLKYFLVFDQGSPDDADNGSLRVAYDAAGAFDQSEQDAFNTYAHTAGLSGAWSTPDTSLPTTPAPFTGTVTELTPSLSWGASSDDDAVASYVVARDGVVVRDTTALTYRDTRAKVGHTYSYTVRAVDLSGNRSAPSVRVRLTVKDTVAPRPPRRLRAAPKRHAVVLRWRPASDNVAVTRYVVWRGKHRLATLKAARDSYRATGLRAHHTYTFVIRARDAAGNLSSPARVTVRTRSG